METASSIGAGQAFYRLTLYQRPVFPLASVRATFDRGSGGRMELTTHGSEIPGRILALPVQPGDRVQATVRRAPDQHRGEWELLVRCDWRGGREPYETVLRMPDEDEVSFGIAVHGPEADPPLRASVLAPGETILVPRGRGTSGPSERDDDGDGAPASPPEPVGMPQSPAAPETPARGRTSARRRRPPGPAPEAVETPAPAPAPGPAEPEMPPPLRQTEASRPAPEGPAVESEPAPQPTPTRGSSDRGDAGDEVSSIQTDTRGSLRPRANGGRYRVWYATNRNPVIDASGVLRGYGVDRSDAVHYGRCDVVIPEGHVIGSLGTPRWRAWLRRLLGRADDRLRVDEVRSHPAAEHWAEIAREARRWAEDERCGVVFLHGYNVSFEAAALRAAQIGFDLQVRGPMSFFSWPSRGSFFGYAADESAIEASEDEIGRYLVDFAQQSGIERLHVIAHSMGNRGLLRALQRIAAQAAAELPVSFRHFILAAPDVDRDLFLDLAQLYGRLARRTTLYVSDRDRALASSSMLRAGAARAGLAPPVTVCPPIDTVHVRNVDLTLLGHGYVAEAREVLGDIHQLLMYDAPPDRRIGLRPAYEGEQQYWVIGA